MLEVPSTIEGKQGFYGDIKDSFEREGFSLGGNWEYFKGFFDHILYLREGVTIYLRLPVFVLSGVLDRDDALLQFGRPFLIKHIMNLGIAEGDMDFSALDITGLSQFQKPRDPDDKIKNEDRWIRAADAAISRINSDLVSV